jgi:hypothetical protein
MVSNHFLGGGNDTAKQNQNQTEGSWHNGCKHTDLGASLHPASEPLCAPEVLV